MTENIMVNIAEGILQLRINRPEKKNALTRDMYTAIAEALRQADTEDSVRVIIITGNDTCFTAGNDLADFLNTPTKDNEQFMLAFLNTLSHVKKPLLAAVNGFAVGVGATLLLHCDLIFAGKNASFQYPFVNLGLIPEAGSTLLLPQLIGYHRAAELLLLGDAISAQKALEFGLINQVCSDELTLKSILEVAKNMANKPVSALCQTKALLKQGQQGELDVRINEEIKYFQIYLHSPQTKEALQAFMEKREPDYVKLR